MTDEHERTGTGWPQPAAAPDRPTQRTPDDARSADEPTPAADPARPVDEPAVPPDEPAPVAETEPEPEPEPVAESAAPEPADQTAPAPPEPGDDGPGEDGPGPSRRKRRLSAAGAVIGLLVGLLGFAFVVQLRSNSTDQQLSADRPEDLVRILSDLDARKDRLSQEINTLQNTQQQLAAGSQSRQAALAEAGRRADELGILAGTLPAQGPGLRIEFRAGAKSIQASDLLDAVEELRGAGAEAMQISGTNNGTVRIVASSSFVDGSGGSLIVDGTSMVGPFTVTVIGDPQTMQIALNIPSGVVDTVHNHSGNVTITSAPMVEVSALHPVTTPRYAQPAG
jgi:uncharacterized protein YlxW (UPF0749 family)